MKKIILFGCFLVIMGLLTSCGKKTMKNQVEGELIKDFVDDEKKGIIPTALFKVDEDYIFNMYPLGLSESKLMKTNDFNHFDRINKNNAGFMFYNYAELFGDKICWMESVNDKNFDYEGIVYSVKDDTMYSCIQLKEEESITPYMSGGYSDCFYYIKKSKEDTVEIHEFNYLTSEDSIIYKAPFYDNKDYSIKVKENLLIALIPNESGTMEILKLNLDEHSQELIDVPSEIDNPVYVDYDNKNNKYAIYEEKDNCNKVFIYDIKTGECELVYEFPPKYKAESSRIEIKDNKILWINRKYNIGGGYLKYYSTMIYDIDSKRITELKGAFNYNFINENEMIYFVYPEVDNVYKVDMYKYNWLQ